MSFLNKLLTMLVGPPIPQAYLSPPPFIDNLHRFSLPYSLHLGCGNIHIDGFCNVDIVKSGAVDALDNIAILKRFPNNSAKEIYACHVLEHFGHDEISPILRRWYEVLEPGGTLRISVPDMDRIVEIYYSNMPHFKKSGTTPWIGLIYGGQSNSYDFHKTGFNASWLGHLMEEVGFERPEEYPHFPHFIPGLVDASVSNAPFGKYFSLNLMATKPKLAQVDV
jgi:predicted SAM-dependent methyltransferase